MLDLMPKDICKHFCRELRYRDVVILSQTCKTLYGVLHDDDVWKHQYDKTWWPREADTYPEENDSQTYYERLSGRIKHIKQILANQPFVTLFLYEQKDSKGMITAKSNYHKISLKKRSSDLTKAVAIINHIERPFRMVIDLPDGRQETILSAGASRYSRPLYYTIGVEYAVQPRSKSEFGNTIPYETLVTCSGVEQKYRNQDRHNRQETVQHEYGRHRRWKRIGCPPVDYGTF